MSSPHRQKWYAEGLRFGCQQCGECCRGESGYVWVMEDEKARIAEFLGLSRTEFGERYLREAGSHDSLIELPDGRCIFHADRNCKIYPVRPVQCLTFPFWRSIVASVETWLECGRECPGVGKGKLYSAEEVEVLVRLSESDLRRPKLFI
jgi:Fe-S-cluster containining protein